MEFSKEDHPTEKELKIRIIDIYNGKLDERDRRKQFVIERGLLDYRKHQQMERRKPKDERELIAQMRPFARFHSAAEHDEFVGALLTAMKLRKRIAQLQQYRKNGFRTLAEAQAYESEEKKRESEAALKKQRESASYLYDSGRQPQSGGRDRANRWLNRERQSVESTSITGGPASTAVSSSRLDIAHAPGADLLTSKEQELCTNLRLLPKVSVCGCFSPTSFASHLVSSNGVALYGDQRYAHSREFSRWLFKKNNRQAIDQNRLVGDETPRFTCQNNTIIP